MLIANTGGLTFSKVHSLFIAIQLFPCGVLFQCRHITGFQIFSLYTFKFLLVDQSYHFFKGMPLHHCAAGLLRLCQVVLTGGVSSFWQSVNLLKISFCRLFRFLVRLSSFRQSSFRIFSSLEPCFIYRSYGAMFP